MLHIVKRPNGKFEVVALDSRSGLLNSTYPQGYDNKAGCIKEIRSTMKNCYSKKPDETILIQDDTTIEPGVWEVGFKAKIFRPDIKPKKKYVFNKKKK